MTNERTMKPISEALKCLMAERKLRPVDVWTAADISRSDLYRYLRGDRGVRMNTQAIRTVEKLARALGVEPDYFLEYRAWRVQEIMRRCPQLVDDVYDFLIGVARVRGVLDERTEDTQ